MHDDERECSCREILDVNVLRTTQYTAGLQLNSRPKQHMIRRVSSPNLCTSSRVPLVLLELGVPAVGFNPA